MMSHKVIINNSHNHNHNHNHNNNKIKLTINLLTIKVTKILQWLIIWPSNTHQCNIVVNKLENKWKLFQTKLNPSNTQIKHCKRLKKVQYM